jgi:hypothetical protein
VDIPSCLPQGDAGGETSDSGTDNKGSAGQRPRCRIARFGF